MVAAVVHEFFGDGEVGLRRLPRVKLLVEKEASAVEADVGRVQPGLASARLSRQIAHMYPDEFRRGIFAGLQIKRSIFVSYHHHGDRAYSDEFTRLFADTYDVVQDNSPEREIDSDDSEYVLRRLREEHITGSSCTVVLCGAGTPQRKFVDWEIKATLDKEHGLIAVQLPTNQQFLVPNRLFDNTQSGYAVWISWAKLTANPEGLPTLVEQANSKSKTLIRNGREMRTRNG